MGTNEMSASAEGGKRYLMFAVADRRIAVDLSQVDRVTHSVEISPVDGLPAVIVGTVDVRGDIVPVVDLRRRLGLSERELELSDQFVLLQRGVWRWLLVTDGVVGVVQFPKSSIFDMVGGQECLVAEARLSDGVVSILEVSRLVSGEEAQLARRVLAQGAAG